MTSTKTLSDRLREPIKAFDGYVLPGKRELCDEAADALDSASRREAELAAGSIDAAVAELDTKIPGAFWHVAKGKLTDTEPLFAALVCIGEREIGHFETDDNAAAAIRGATADALTKLEVLP